VPDLEAEGETMTAAIPGKLPTPTLRRRRWLRTVLVAGGCWLLAGQGAARAQHPNVARGAGVSGMFDVGGIDTVNALNGNLVITIPIGQSYPVGGTMGSTSFSLVYNSNVWSHLDAVNADATTSVWAISDPAANAGLGWRFSLGRLATDFGIPGFQAPANGEAKTWFAPDGGEHYLFGQPADPAWFSADGSYLRFQTATQTLELPDGTRHVFDGNGFPTSIVDRFGNGLSITYVPFPAPNGDLASEWDIGDNWGRTHRVVFRLTGYGGYEQRAVVDHIDLQGFAGSTSTYQFLYNGETAPGVNFQPVQMQGHGTSVPPGEPGWNPRVFLLTRLVQPDGTTYTMPIASYQGQGSSPAGYPGPINALQLPTGGTVAWSYAETRMPQPTITSKGWLRTVWSPVLGVAMRSLFDAGGAWIGDWKYATTFDAVTGPNEIVRQITYPPADPGVLRGTDGHRVVTYYSSCVHATCSGTPTTYATDYGLPFSRLRAGDGAGRFLSQEVFEQGATAPVRRVYVNYDDDGNPSQADEPIYANQRLRSRATYFLDDPLSGGAGACATTPAACASVATDLADYDGLGHYRQTTTSDSFGFGTAHVERTEWNQYGPPALAQPWVLDTFTFQQQSEGSDSERQEAAFEAATGFLHCLRRQKNAGGRGIHDVMVTYDHDALGNVTSEKWFGGDGAVVSTAGACPANGDAPTYSYTHAYAAGSRSSTTVRLDSTHTLSLLNLTIDPGTGLPSVATDPSGRPTSFAYDAMGRPKTISPRGDATTVVTYPPTTAAPQQITRAVGPSGPALEQETWGLDGFGRTVEDAVTLPGGGAATTATTYDALGWTTKISEPSSSAGTSFQGQDAFGRPAMVVTADGKRSYFGYFGARTITRTRWVQQRTQQTDAGGHLVWVVGEQPAITRETYDGLGRLRQVRDPQGVLTHYHYDVGGRLDAVLSAAGGGKQVRSFQYDGRGFRFREVSSESGATSYRYDAGGQLIQKSTALGTVLMAYDAAGRLAHVKTPSGTSTMKLKDFDYDTAPNGAGKVATAHAYNWRSADSCAVPYEVRQDLAYDSGHGRLAQETTSLLHNGTLESWQQSYAYDGAGRIIQTTYPSCLTLCSAAARTVTSNYAYGRPVSVPGLAPSIGYNPNATVGSVSHQNGVVFSQIPDPRGMARPAALGVQSPAGAWPMEPYAYDGSGDITQIGAKSFIYDGNARLAAATQPAAGSLPYQELQYDAFGNIVQISRGTAPGNLTTWVTYTTDPASNHLAGASYNGDGTLASYQGTNYLWDPLQQLTDVYIPSAEAWVHTYDASGERTWSWRTAPSRLDSYALRGQDGHVLSLFTKSGGAYTWEDYVYREGLLLGAKLSDGTVRHFDVDHLGSLRLESDQAGQNFVYHEYWPYGEELTATGSSERMRFTGHERDLGVASAPIDYLHARYYRPLFGRFVSADPLGGDPAEPGSWNRYGYVLGSPLIASDPYGLSGPPPPPPAGEAPNFYILLGDSVNAVTAPWQFAPGPNTGTWGLGSLQTGSLQFLNDFRAGGGSTAPDRPPGGRTAQSAKAGGKRCAPYWTLVKMRFKMTNDFVPGFTVPPFSSGIIAGGAMARATGLMSFRQFALQGGWRGLSVGAFTLTTGETFAAVALNSSLAYLAVSAVFEAGVGVGSLLGAGLDIATNCAEGTF
jgi:RHS repeat-associated protein